jgi:hypothetical protein
MSFDSDLLASKLCRISNIIASNLSNRASKFVQEFSSIFERFLKQTFKKKSMAERSKGNLRGNLEVSWERLMG